MTSLIQNNNYLRDYTDTDSSRYIQIWCTKISIFVALLTNPSKVLKMIHIFLLQNLQLLKMTMLKVFLFVTRVLYIGSVQCIENNFEHINHLKMRVPWNIVKIEFSDYSPAELILVDRNPMIVHSNYIFIRMYRYFPSLKATKIMSDCTDIPYKIILSETEGCKYGKKIKMDDQLRTKLASQACSAFVLFLNGTESLSFNVTVQYKDPESGTLISAIKEFHAYNNLQIISPELSKPDHSTGGFPYMTLSIGSSLNTILSGGPQQRNYDSRCYQIEVYDPDIIKVIPYKWNVTSENITTHNLEVTCLSEGVSTFLVSVGRVGKYDM